MYWNLHKRAKHRHQIVQARHVQPLEAIGLAALFARQLFIEREHVERLCFAAWLANARARVEAEVVAESEKKMNGGCE